MPVRLVLIADDLTGALDAAAPFADGRLKVVVATRPGATEAAMASGADVVSVNCGSREGSADDAVAVLKGVLCAVGPDVILFKKIDSRLKGHIAAELAALSQARRFSSLLVCPAIPDLGRFVETGEVTGFGVAAPLPVREAAGMAGGLVIEAPDARTDDDIDAMLAAAPAGTLYAGARGLAAGLARRMGALRPRQPDLPLALPIAMAIGSRDPITLRQVETLMDESASVERILAPDGAAMVRPSGARLAVLQVSEGAGNVPAAEVTTRFARQFVDGWVKDRAALVLTGGETAAAVLSAMGITLLDILGEVIAGLPLSRPLDFSGAPLIVSKSGGFGTPDSLARLVRPAGDDRLHSGTRGAGFQA